MERKDHTMFPAMIFRKLIVSLLIIQSLCFVIVFGAVILSTDILKNEIAVQITNGVRKDLIEGDIRSVIIALNKAKKNNFDRIGFIQDGKWKIVIPDDIDDKDVRSQNNIFHAQLKLPIHFDEEKSELIGELYFVYDRLRVIYLATIIWLMFIIVSIPIALRVKKKLINDYKNEMELKNQAAIGKITALLAHDVRKPFSQVKLILDAYDKFKSSPILLEKAKNDVEKSLKNVESMITDVMDFSREVELEVESKEIEKVIGFSIKQVFQTIKNAQIDFNYDLNCQYNPLIDEERMIRVFSNLIGNAVEAIYEIGKRNKGNIEFKSRDYIENNKRYVEIVVGNDGPSIPGEDIDKVFESFYTSGKNTGTGLGLASAKKIVKLHCGQISVRNKSGNRGVEFIIRIPASNNSSTGGEGYHSLPNNNQEILYQDDRISMNDELLKRIDSGNLTYKILMLEDEVLYRAWVKDLIIKNPILQKSVILYDVSTVEEALELLEKNKDINYGIIDIDLGKSNDGFDFLEKAKLIKDFRCIVHTNRTLDVYKEKALKLGASDLIPKPLQLESLLKLITQSSKGRNNQDKNGNKKIKVYFCDDTELIRVQYKLMCEEFMNEEKMKLSYKVFDKGEDLLAAAKRESPDIIFTDYNMRESGGKLNGYDVIREIKKVSKDIHAYLISNKPTEISRLDVKNIGGDGALNHPISNRSILKILKMSRGA